MTLSPDQPGQSPDFLVIGAVKAGSTSLYHWLAGHPGLGLSKVKETDYFLFEKGQPDLPQPGDEICLRGTPQRNWQDYMNLFPSLPKGALLGEVSPLYLYSPGAAERILAQAPKVKLIVYLREPAARAWSHFSHFVRDGVHRAEEADKLFADICKPPFDYPGWPGLFLRLGFYGQQLQSFLNTFPADQVHLGLFENLVADPQKEMAKVFSFLGVDPKEEIDSKTRRNVSGNPRSRTLHRLLRDPSGLKSFAKLVVPKKLRRNLKKRAQNANLESLACPPEINTQLREIYADDVALLAETTDLDLSPWGYLDV